MEKTQKQIYNILKNNLPKSKIIFDEDILDKYARDETSDLEAVPDIVIRAENRQEVSAVLKLCNDNDIFVTPRGAGSGVTGGSVAVNGGVVLSLERMNKIIEIDKENMVAVVEPGAITGDIQSAVLGYGLIYPPDPASLDICAIGGNVAENSGGPKAVKYGITKDYILGLEFVLMDGSVIETGGKFVKNATGYNLIGMLIGSEGTLAVITKIYLKLLPAPEISYDLLIPFFSIEEAMDAVHKILINRITPSTIEFMEADAISLVAKYQKIEIPFQNAGAHLLIEIDGKTEDEILFDIEKISSIMKESVRKKIIVAQSKLQKERLWKTRRFIRDSIQEESPVFLAEDSVVPRSEIPKFIKKIKKLLEKKKLKSIIFGHAGDGNLHIDILKGEMEYIKWQEIIPFLKKEIYQLAIDFGGTISGEHGIGFTRKNYLSMKINEAEMELYRNIKKAFDPKKLLNPGKVIPDKKENGEVL